MSMTSKVNATLRQQIVDYLARTGYSITNRGLVSALDNRYSLRTIQEATQKLTKNDTLFMSRDSFGTFYGLNTTIPVATGVGLAATV